MNQHDQMREALREVISLVDEDVVCVKPSDRQRFIAALERWNKALAHVNETPKNEHDSDDVLKRAPLVRLTEYELIGLMYDTNALPECEPTQKELIDFANAIMDAMERKNGG